MLLLILFSPKVHWIPKNPNKNLWCPNIHKICVPCNQENLLLKLYNNVNHSEKPAPFGKAISKDFNSYTEFSLRPVPRPNSSKNYSFFTQSPSPAQILQEWLNFHPVPRHHGSSSYNAKGLKYAPPIMTQNNFSVILNFQCTQSPKSGWKKTAVLDLTADAEGKNCVYLWKWIHVKNELAPPSLRATFR